MNEDAGKIFSAVMADGERATLTWRNSQFGLLVTEVFIARGGVLVQDQVAFSLPDGTPPPRVSPRDVDDLYHTGGPFDARGLSRPFRRIVYRIGEIGDPKLRVGNETVALKQAAGFGGRVILTATRPALHEILRLRTASRLRRLWAGYRKRTTDRAAPASTTCRMFTFRRSAKAAAAAKSTLAGVQGTAVPNRRVM